MILFILRGAFVVLAASVATLYLVTTQEGARLGFGQFVAMLGIVLGIVLTVIAFDASTPRKRLSAVGGLFLGLIAGLVAAYALSLVVDLVGLYLEPQRMAGESDANFLTRQGAFARILEGVKVLLGLITCYAGISLVMQTKDDFRFVIPYVEFAKEIRGNRPTVIDSSVLIDGRILDIFGTHILQGTLYIPRFVLQELQTLADSGDNLKRARGRRGLDVVQKLQETPGAEVVLDDREVDGIDVDQKLLSLSQDHSARLMTNDFNLNKIAAVRGIDVINLNDLAKAMRPVVLPGEPMMVKIVKPGEGPTQGVGYLDDGTMIVVDQARDKLDKTVQLEVTSTLQTSAGRMIFGRMTNVVSDAESEEIASHDASPNDNAPARGGGVKSRRNPRRRL